MHKMLLEVLAIICLLSRTDCKKDWITSFNAKENRARKVPGNPRSSCTLEPDPIHGSGECLIACLTKSQSLYGFGWNKNSSECRCCHQPTETNANKINGEGWETYLPGCSDIFSTVLHGETAICLYMYQRREMSYSEAMSHCKSLGGELVKSTSTTGLKWMTGVVNFIEVVEDDAIKPFVCEKDPAFENCN